MTIFFDARPLLSKIKSGIPEYAKNLTKAIIELNQIKNYQLLFFANNYHNKNISSHLISPKQVINFRFSNKLFILSNFLFSLPKIDKMVPADIFYSFHFDILSLSSPQKRILTVHDLSFLYFPEFFNWKINIWHKVQKLKKQLQEAGQIITVSNFTKNTILERYKIDEDRIKVIYPGISSTYFKLNKDDPTLKVFQKTKKIDYPFILNVSTIEPRKNHLGLFEAFRLLKTKKKFKDFKLVIVGEKGWKYKDIIKYVFEHRLEKEIIFWGKAKEEELLYLYNLSTVFVFPSFFEGFGFPPLEAQSCGTPVISSSRTSLPEVLGDSAVFVDPYKVYDLENALEEVILNENLREGLIEKGLKNVVKFKWETTAQEVFRVIENL